MKGRRREREKNWNGKVRRGEERSETRRRGGI